mgnify:CR=1 FL=1
MPRWEKSSTTKIVLLIGVIAVSFSAIFIRLSTAPPLALAFYRMFFATIALLPIALTRDSSRNQIMDLTGKQLLLMTGAGLFLSIHFGVWVISLSHTTVASSVVLVTTQPIFLTFFEYFLLKKKPSNKLLLGILIATVGGTLIGYGDLLGSQAKVLGDLLALSGALMAAGYFFIGGTVRQKLNNIPYITVVYGITAIFLLIFCLLMQVPLVGYSAYNMGLFLLLALVPTLIGHTSFNWALKDIRASRVGTTILGEPVGASILAAIMFKEVPGPIPAVGGLIVLIGIYVVWKTKSRPRP